MSNMEFKVAQDVIDAAGEGTWMAVKGSKMGFPCVIDFYTYMAICGNAYQIRAGTVATPLAADSVLTDTAAQASIDALLGTTLIAVELGLGLRDVATATTLQCALKAVGAVSSAGTAFVPLPMLQGGPAAATTARVATDGGVTVAAELATTTRRLWEFEAIQAQSATVITDTALGSMNAVCWKPTIPYIGRGPACVYLQVASTTAFTLHFGHINYIELTSTGID